MRSLLLGCFVAVGLATFSGTASADIGPGPSPSVNRNFPSDAPRRTGPLRSCGSGMGAGLAGIGLASGALWLGQRFARAVRRP